MGAQAWTLAHSYDPIRDVLTIEGKKYSGCLFRKLSLFTPGEVFRVNSCEGGVLEVTTIYIPPAGFPRMISGKTTETP
jgi:hypothetical protein